MLDDRDRKLLTLLQQDADTPLALLAERVHLSVSACSRRVARLKELGYVSHQVAILDRKKAGLPTTIFVVLNAARHSAEWLEAFRGAVAAIPEIVEVHRLTGNFDYIAKIVLPNVEHYDVVYKRLVALVPLRDVSAYISMETMKAGTALPTDFA